MFWGCQRRLSDTWCQLGLTHESNNKTGGAGMKKHILSMILVWGMILTWIPTIALAENAATTPTLQNEKIRVGDCIPLGSYYGSPIVWRCVAIDENGPLMLSDKILCLKAYDAKGNSDYHYVPGTFSSIRKQYGSNCYADSNIRQWLNSTETHISWTHDEPSSPNVLGGNTYNNESGFLSSANFSAEERSYMKSVTRKVYTNEAENTRGVTDGGSKEHIGVDGLMSAQNRDYTNCYYMYVTDTVFIPDLDQLVTVYYNLGNEYVKACPTEQAVTHSDYSSGDLNSETPYKYWITHAGTNGYSYEWVRFIAEDGTCSGSRAWDGAIGIRPAFYLDESTWNNGGEVDTPPIPAGISDMYPAPNSTVDLWINDPLKCSITFTSEIEAGPGKIYLRNYSTSKIIKTIAYDDENATEWFDCDGNTLSFTMSSQIGSFIPRGEKVYLTIDSDAVVIKDGSKFEGINNKDMWSFTTRFGLTEYSERVNFRNSTKDFFENYSTESSSYPISSAELKLKLEGIIGKKELNKRLEKKDEFDGACFGISAVTALYKMNMLNPSAFDSGSATLFDMKKPKDSIQSYGVRDLINYYFMLQFTEDYRLSGLDTLWANFFRDKDDFKKKLEEIVNAGLNMDMSKKVLVLNYGWMEAGFQGARQHSVVLCSAKQTDSGDYELLIKDPNAGILTTMHVASDYSSFTYDDKNIVIVKTIDVTTIPSNWLIGATASTLSLGSAKSFADESYDTLRVVAYGNFTIANSLGETLAYNDGYLGGTMEVFYEDFVASGNGDYAEFVYKVNKSEGYIFTSEDSRSSCTVKDDVNYIYVDAENASSIVMNKGTGISIQGNDLEYSVYATTGTGNNFFAITGQMDKYLNITLNSDGSGTVEADTLENTIFKSLYEGTTWVFDGDSTSVDFVETDGGLSLSDNENNGPYTVIFDATGGSLSSENTMTTDKRGKLTLLPPAPTRDGYTFDGWFTTPDGGEKITTDTVFTEDTTVYAHWTQIITPPEPTVFTITFNANNGTVTPSTMTTNEDGKLAELPTPVRNGYSFNGWFTAFTGGTQVTVNTVFTSDATVYARWTYNSGIQDGNNWYPPADSTTPTAYRIVVPAVSGGTVNVRPTSAKKGDTVTIIVTPDSGYELDYITVTDRNGNDVPLTDRGNGKYVFTMPDGNVTLNCAFKFIKADSTDQPTISFIDVVPGVYYYDAVAWAVAQGITNGTTTTTFSPNAPCTRGQIVTFLWRAAGSPSVSGSSPFTDVQPGDYWYDAVLWAVSMGITTGTSASTFSPNDTCTRGQAVTFLYRNAGSPTVTTSATFTDVALDAYYSAAVAWALAKTITNGTTASTFSPKDQCTRGQIVTFLYRSLGE